MTNWPGSIFGTNGNFPVKTTHWVNFTKSGLIIPFDEFHFWILNSDKKWKLRINSEWTQDQLRTNRGDKPAKIQETSGEKNQDNIEIILRKKLGKRTWTGLLLCFYPSLIEKRRPLFFGSLNRWDDHTGWPLDSINQKQLFLRDVMRHNATCKVIEYQEV